MPEGSVPQQFHRYPLVLPLQHRRPGSPGPAGVGWTRDLSEGGACLELADRLQRQRALQLRLRTAQGAIEAEARVIWQQELPAAGQLLHHGVLFTQLAPTQRQGLRDLLLAQRQEHRGGLRLPVALGVTCHVRGGPPLRGQTGNLSRTGLLLRLAQALPPGTAVALTLHAPRGPIPATGEVVWVDPGYRQSFGDPVRHGVHFTTLGGPTALSLARLLVEAS